MSVSTSSVPESGAPEAGVNAGGDEMVNASEELKCAIIAQTKTKNLLFMRVVHLPPISRTLYDGIAGASGSANVVPSSDYPNSDLRK